LAEWYYIGHYGQLGPLTKEQIDELVEGGVITRETYVWRTGMAQWVPADQTPEIKALLDRSEPFVSPPPPPNAPMAAPPVRSAAVPYGTDLNASAYSAPFRPIRSDRSRTLAGLLQIIIPGVGRMYLGYAAYGVFQLLLVPFACFGWAWSIIDGIIMLAGGVKLDGYGRQLAD
jgi:hypothetical protein